MKEEKPSVYAPTSIEMIPINVRVPLETIHRLRTEASERKTSVSAIIRSLICTSEELTL